MPLNSDLTRLANSANVLATAITTNATAITYFLSSFGVSNPNTFSGGSFTTNTGVNTVLAGPYTIAPGNTLVIATGSRVVIV